ncbi:MAG: ABC transporter ATP-binding protein [Mariprofundaceae bacterium]|nr:ABC transporter ATP-binding protein [Mariprofundaceae bacterium]
MRILEARDLSLRRGQRELIRGLNFHLQAGRISVVLGPNGAGKSSLLLALSGMLDLAAGAVYLNAKPLAAYARKDISDALAWQGDVPSAEFGITVDQRLQLAMSSGLHGDIDRGKRLAACATQDLLPLRHRSLATLSSGERQRVELAALMVRDCPIWLLDEPCAHLDIRHQVAWLNSMRDKANGGMAMLAVLHDVQQAAAIADDVILIYGDGRVRSGPAGELLVPEILNDLLHTELQFICNGVADGILVPDYSATNSRSMNYRGMKTPNL